MPPTNVAPETALGILHVRLLTPLSSIDSRVGTEFRSVVIEAFRSSKGIQIPVGAIVSGTVISRTSVGLGLLRERSSLSVGVLEYVFPNGRRYQLGARVLRVDNGREYVTPDGKIRGVLAADSPQQVVRGVWLRPSLTLLGRSAFGLTGVSGRIWKSYSLGPIGALALIGLHCALFQMPDPEIFLPAGAELTFSVLKLGAGAPVFDEPAPAVVPSSLANLLGAQPSALVQDNGLPVGDVINMAFLGTRAELLNAFRAAGWTVASPFSGRAFVNSYVAFAAKQGYADAPVSNVLYRGTCPDLVFEKSLNNIAMRHHLRVWEIHADGHEFWLGAATHDIGMGFDSHRMRFSHRIQPNLDLERNKVANDLAFSDCSDELGFVDRAEAEQSLTDGSPVQTDGRLAVIALRQCGSLAAKNQTEDARRGRPFVFRLFRSLVLESRQYVERENAAYWVYRAVRWGRAWRSQAGVEAEY